MRVLSDTDLASGPLDHAVMLPDGYDDSAEGYPPLYCFHIDDGPDRQAANTGEKEGSPCLRNSSIYYPRSL